MLLDGNADVLGAVSLLRTKAQTYEGQMRMGVKSLAGSGNLFSVDSEID